MALAAARETFGPVPCVANVPLRRNPNDAAAIIAAPPKSVALHSTATHASPKRKPKNGGLLESGQLPIKGEQRGVANWSAAPYLICAMYKFATWEKRAVIFKMPSEAWMLVPHAIAPYWERCNVADAFTKASALTEKQFRAMYPDAPALPDF
jgi:hypothetical protein